MGYLAVAWAFLADSTLPTTLHMRTLEDVIRTSCRPGPTRRKQENVAYLPGGLDRPVLVNLKVAVLVLLGGAVTVGGALRRVEFINHKH